MSLLPPFAKRRLARAAGARARRPPPTRIASRLVIRDHASWLRRLPLWFLAVSALGLGGLGIYHWGQLNAGHDRSRSQAEIQALRQELAQLRQREAQLTRQAAASATQLRIEQGARQSLEAQNRQLENDVQHLNQDLALFENLFPAPASDGAPAIRAFRLDPLSPAAGESRWRYRLLATRSAQAAGHFEGQLEVLLKYRLEGREYAVKLPGSGMSPQALKFERHQRVEGRLATPAGARLLGVTVRILENGAIRAEYTHRPTA